MGKETLGNDINIEFAIPDNAIPKPMAQKDVDTGAVIKIRDYYDGTKLNLKALEKIGKVQVQCLLEDKKKLTRITISSYFDHSSGVMFGEFADAEKKVHKRYSILKPAYDLDLTKPAQMKEFLALMSERFTFGGLKPEAPFLFKVVSKNKEKELEEEKADMIESAFEHIRSASENQRINMGVMIGLFGWHDLSDKQRILYILPPNRRASIIAQYLKENPESEFILKW